MRILLENIACSCCVLTHMTNFLNSIWPEISLFYHLLATEDEM